LRKVENSLKELKKSLEEIKIREIELEKELEGLKIARSELRVYMKDFFKNLVKKMENSSISGV
jgi:hypothetical protein